MDDTLERLATALRDRYVVEREIGRGGMATVYLARDVRHERPVALKVLNAELGAVLGTERFLAEIRVTANLQHPHLLPLFDSGEAAGLLYYVMPFVAGESLRARLEREGALPVPEAVRLATAVAGALQHAHRHGVVHRDLKPENILLQDGQPLVADFGIALAVSRAGGQRVTQTGLSLGTPQYMSPEQATADRVVDARSDVYALGAVTYEMLAGEPPHDGKSAQAIIAKLLSEKPRPLRRLRESVPAGIEAAVDRALAMLPGDRWQTAQEFADALATGSARTTDVPTRVVGWSTARLAMFAAGALLAGVALGALARGRAGTSAGAASPLIRHAIDVPTGISVARAYIGLAISPDGKFTAFEGRDSTGSPRLLVRAASEVEAREVPGTVGATTPTFTPDGQWLVFLQNGRLMRVAPAGGRPEFVVDCAGCAEVAWGPGDVVVVSVEGGLARLNVASGQQAPLVTHDSSQGLLGASHPRVSTDGRFVLFTALVSGGGASGGRLAVVALGGGTPTITALPAARALGQLGEMVVFNAPDGVVMAVRLVLDGARVLAPPISFSERASALPGAPQADAALSANGDLVLVTVPDERQLVQIVGDSVERVLLAEARRWHDPRVSPDGRHVALDLDVPGGTREVWLYDLPRGPLRRLTQGTVGEDRPEWLPDSRAVLVRAHRRPRNVLVTRVLDTPDEPRTLLALPDAHADQGVVSPDGTWLAYQRDRTGRGEIWIRRMEGDTTPRLVGWAKMGEFGPRFSPDSRLLAFASGADGVTRTYLVRLDSLTQRVDVSRGPGSQAIFARDGRAIFFLSPSRELWRVPIDVRPPFVRGPAQRVPMVGATFGDIHADFDVSPDGRGLIALRPVAASRRIVMIAGWRALLDERLRGAR